MKWVSIISRLRQNKEVQVNRHFVFIEADAKIVAPEIILWGEATWWPEKCSMRFIRKTPGAVAVGTRYEQKVMLPLAPRWDAEVTRLVADTEIERTFLNGPFEGFERVTLEPRLNGTRVDYCLHYKIRGKINTVLWAALFVKLHDKNIEMILTALKNYLVKKVKQSKRI